MQQKLAFPCLVVFIILAPNLSPYSQAQPSYSTQADSYRAYSKSIWINCSPLKTDPILLNPDTPSIFYSVDKDLFIETQWFIDRVTISSTLSFSKKSLRTRETLDVNRNSLEATLKTYDTRGELRHVERNKCRLIESSLKNKL